MSLCSIYTFFKYLRALYGSDSPISVILHPVILLKILPQKGTKTTKKENIEDPDPSGINSKYMA